MKCIRFFFLVFVFYAAASSHTAEGAQTIDIKRGDEWRFFRGSEDPPGKWRSNGFDDSSWEKGPSGFGYGPGKHNTVLGDMKGKYRSVYVRRVFTVHDYHAIKNITLSVHCDGPFVAYLNGIEAIRTNKPQRGEPLDLTGFGHELDHKKNLVAVKCSNDDINSDDFSFIPVFSLVEE